jgi:hypothetical protein
MSVISLKDKIGIDLLAIVIDDVFTDEECKAIIEDAEDKGFQDVHMNKYGAVFKNEKIRTDLALSEDNRLLSHTIFMRISSVVKTHDPEVLKLSTNLRYSKYETGGFCVPHVDAPYIKDGVMSKYTMILYLNTAKKGQTRLFNIETMKYHDVEPVCGRVLVFDQRVPHAALNASGVKYAVRTDVLIDDPYVNGKLSISRKMFIGSAIDKKYADSTSTMTGSIVIMD